MNTYTFEEAKGKLKSSSTKKFDRFDLGSTIKIPMTINYTTYDIDFEIIGLNSHKDSKNPNLQTITLMSKNILEIKDFNDTQEDVSYVSSSIREYLNSNNGFLKYFSNNVKSHLSTPTIYSLNVSLKKLNENNVDPNSLYEVITNDYVFLPSISELTNKPLNLNDYSKKFTNYFKTINDTIIDNKKFNLNLIHFNFFENDFLLSGNTFLNKTYDPNFSLHDEKLKHSISTTYYFNNLIEFSVNVEKSNEEYFSTPIKLNSDLKFSTQVDSGVEKVFNNLYENNIEIYEHLLFNVQNLSFTTNSENKNLSSSLHSATSEYSFMVCHLEFDANINKIVTGTIGLTAADNDVVLKNNNLSYTGEISTGSNNITYPIQIEENEKGGKNLSYISLSGYKVEISSSFANHIPLKIYQTNEIIISGGIFYKAIKNTTIDKLNDPNCWYKIQIYDSNNKDLILNNIFIKDNYCSKLSDFTINNYSLYDPSAVYNIDNMIIYDGIVYKALKDNITIKSLNNYESWQIIDLHHYYDTYKIGDITFKDNKFLTISTELTSHNYKSFYNKEDLIIYNGYFYKTLSNNNSTYSNLKSKENWYKIDLYNSKKSYDIGDLVINDDYIKSYNGVSWDLATSDLKNYNVNDFIISDGYFYKAIKNTTLDTLKNNLNWEDYWYKVENYNKDSLYYIDDLVLNKDDRLVYSIQNELISCDKTTYKKNEIMIKDGSFYKAMKDNVTTRTLSNPDDWYKIEPHTIKTYKHNYDIVIKDNLVQIYNGTRWVNYDNNYKDVYNLDEIIIYNGIFYKAKNDNVTASTLSNTDDWYEIEPHNPAKKYEHNYDIVIKDNLVKIYNGSQWVVINHNYKPQSYDEDEIMILDGNFFKAKKDNVTTNTLSNPDNWDEIGSYKSFQFYPIASMFIKDDIVQQLSVEDIGHFYKKSYNQNDLIIISGDLYLSLLNGNLSEWYDNPIAWTRIQTKDEMKDQNITSYYCISRDKIMYCFSIKNNKKRYMPPFYNICKNSDNYLINDLSVGFYGEIYISTFNNHNQTIDMSKSLEYDLNHENLSGQSDTPKWKKIKCYNKKTNYSVGDIAIGVYNNDNKFYTYNGNGWDLSTNDYKTYKIDDIIISGGIFYKALKNNVSHQCLNNESRERTIDRWYEISQYNANSGYFINDLIIKDNFAKTISHSTTTHNYKVYNIDDLAILDGYFYKSLLNGNLYIWIENPEAWYKIEEYDETKTYLSGDIVIKDNLAQTWSGSSWNVTNCFKNTNTYNANESIISDGIFYKALKDNVTTSTLSDPDDWYRINLLNSTTYKDGDVIIKNNLIQTWNGSRFELTSHNYKYHDLNDIVIYNGIFYKSIKERMLYDWLEDPEAWYKIEEYDETATYKNRDIVISGNLVHTYNGTTWNLTSNNYYKTSYNLNEIIISSGIFYKALKDDVTISTLSNSDNWYKIIPHNDDNNYKLNDIILIDNKAQTITPKNVSLFSSNRIYYVNEIIINDGIFYKALIDNASINELNNESIWYKIQPNTNSTSFNVNDIIINDNKAQKISLYKANHYKNINTYDKNDIVIFDGSFYKSLKDENSFNDINIPSAWYKICDVKKYTPNNIIIKDNLAQYYDNYQWNNTGYSYKTLYNVNEIIISNGVFYKALFDNVSPDQIDDLISWYKIEPYNPFKDYVNGNVVISGNYVCTCICKANNDLTNEIEWDLTSHYYKEEYLSGDITISDGVFYKALSNNSKISDLNNEHSWYKIKSYSKPEKHKLNKMVIIDNKAQILTNTLANHNYKNTYNTNESIISSGIFYKSTEDMMSTNDLSVGWYKIEKYDENDKYKSSDVFISGNAENTLITSLKTILTNHNNNETSYKKNEIIIKDGVFYKALKDGVTTSTLYELEDWYKIKQYNQLSSYSKDDPSLVIKDNIAVNASSSADFELANNLFKYYNMNDLMISNGIIYKSLKDDNLSKYIDNFESWNSISKYLPTKSYSSNDIVIKNNFIQKLNRNDWKLVTDTPHKTTYSKNEYLISSGFIYKALKDGVTTSTLSNPNNWYKIKHYYNQNDKFYKGDKIISGNKICYYIDETTLQLFNNYDKNKTYDENEIFCSEGILYKENTDNQISMIDNYAIKDGMLLTNFYKKYDDGDIIINNGNLYISISNNNDSSFINKADKWKQISFITNKEPTADDEGNIIFNIDSGKIEECVKISGNIYHWCPVSGSTNKSYANKDDIVIISGYLYYCKVDNTQILDDLVYMNEYTSYWEKIELFKNYQSYLDKDKCVKDLKIKQYNGKDWNIISIKDKNYFKNEIVLSDGIFYMAKIDYTNINYLSDPEHWYKIKPYEKRTYVSGDLVMDNDLIKISYENSGAIYFNNFSYSYNDLYSKNDIVIYNGVFYKSLQDENSIFNIDSSYYWYKIDIFNKSTKYSVNNDIFMINGYCQNLTTDYTSHYYTKTYAVNEMIISGGIIYKAIQDDVDISTLNDEYYWYKINLAKTLINFNNKDIIKNNVFQKLNEKNSFENVFYNYKKYNKNDLAIADGYFYKALLNDVLYKNIEDPNQWYKIEQYNSTKNYLSGDIVIEDNLVKTYDGTTWNLAEYNYKDVYNSNESIISDGYFYKAIQNNVNTSTLNKRFYWYKIEQYSSEKTYENKDVVISGNLIKTYDDGEMNLTSHNYKSYIENEIVIYDGNPYYYIYEPGGSYDWIKDTLAWRKIEAYDPGVSYDIGSIVIKDNYAFLLNSKSHWELANKRRISYNLNEIVISSGIFYKALYNNLSIDSINNETYWYKIEPYDSLRNYKEGDIIIKDNLAKGFYGGSWKEVSHYAKDAYDANDILISDGYFYKALYNGKGPNNISESEYWYKIEQYDPAKKYEEGDVVVNNNLVQTYDGESWDLTSHDYKTYYKGELIISNGEFYKALENNVSENCLSNKDYWEKIDIYSAYKLNSVVVKDNEVQTIVGNPSYNHYKNKYKKNDLILFNGTLYNANNDDASISDLNKSETWKCYEVFNENSIIKNDPIVINADYKNYVLNINFKWEYVSHYYKDLYNINDIIILDGIFYEANKNDVTINGMSGIYSPDCWKKIEPFVSLKDEDIIICDNEVVKINDNSLDYENFLFNGDTEYNTNEIIITGGIFYKALKDGVTSGSLINANNWYKIEPYNFNKEITYKYSNGDIIIKDNLAKKLYDTGWEIIGHDYKSYNEDNLIIKNGNIYKSLLISGNSYYFTEDQKAWYKIEKFNDEKTYEIGDIVVSSNYIITCKMEKYDQSWDSTWELTNWFSNKKAYKAGELIISGGILYKALKDGVETSTLSNPDNWYEYLISKIYKVNQCVVVDNLAKKFNGSDWETIGHNYRTYNANEIVISNGIFYKSLKDRMLHIWLNDPNAWYKIDIFNEEKIYNIDDIVIKDNLVQTWSGSYWYLTNHWWKGDYGYGPYKANEIIIFNGVFFKAMKNGVKLDTLSTKDDWYEIDPIELKSYKSGNIILKDNYVQTYNDDHWGITSHNYKSYYSGEIVIKDGLIYNSLSDENLYKWTENSEAWYKIEPYNSTNTYKSGNLAIKENLIQMYNNSKWSLISHYGKASSAYNKNEIIIYNGILYKAMIDNVKINALTNPYHWYKIEPYNSTKTYKSEDIVISSNYVHTYNGSEWKLTSHNYKTYDKNDLVIFDGSFYKSLLISGNSFDDINISSAWYKIKPYNESIASSYESGNIVISSNYVHTYNGTTWDLTNHNNDKTSYNLNETIISGGIFYKAMRDGVATSALFNPNDWYKIRAYELNEIIILDNLSQMWNGSHWVRTGHNYKVYKVNEIAIKDGIVYKSLLNGNLYNWVEDPAAWYEFKIHDETKTYEIDDISVIDNLVKIYNGSQWTTISHWWKGDYGYGPYNKNEIIIYNGIFYKALKDNVTTNTLSISSDWYKIEEYDKTKTYKHNYDIVLSGNLFKIYSSLISQWVNYDHNYKYNDENDIVIYNGIFYKSLKDENSFDDINNPEAWYEIEEYNESIANSYISGDIVISGNLIQTYNGSKWELTNHNYKTSYNLNEIIIYNGIFYKALKDGVTTSTLSNSNNWYKIKPYKFNDIVMKDNLAKIYNNINTWNVVSHNYNAYNIDDIYISDGYFYISLISGNSFENIADTKAWYKIEPYNSTKTYKNGDKVIRDNLVKEWNGSSWVNVDHNYKDVYNLNEIIISGGIFYKAMEDDVETSTLSDPNDWYIIEPDITYIKDQSVMKDDLIYKYDGTSLILVNHNYKLYNKGEIIISDGIFYKAKKDNVDSLTLSSSNDWYKFNPCNLIDLYTNGNISLSGNLAKKYIGTTITKNNININNTNWEHDINLNEKQFNKDEIIISGGIFYKAKIDNVSTSNLNNWYKIEQYKSTKTYKNGDIVIEGNLVKTYNGSKWELTNHNYKTYYDINDIVIFNGVFYKAISVLATYSNINNDLYWERIYDYNNYNYDLKYDSFNIVLSGNTALYFKDINEYNSNILTFPDFPYYNNIFYKYDIKYNTNIENYNNKKTYNVNDVIVYNNKYYICETAIKEPGFFDETYWISTYNVFEKEEKRIKKIFIGNKIDNNKEFNTFLNVNLSSSIEVNNNMFYIISEIKASDIGFDYTNDEIEFLVDGSFYASNINKNDVYISLNGNVLYHKDTIQFKLQGLISISDNIDNINIFNYFSKYNFGELIYNFSYNGFNYCIKSGKIFVSDLIYENYIGMNGSYYTRSIYDLENNKISYINEDGNLTSLKVNLNKSNIGIAPIIVLKEELE